MERQLSNGDWKQVSVCSCICVCGAHCVCVCVCVCVCLTLSPVNCFERFRFCFLNFSVRKKVPSNHIFYNR